MEDIHTLIFQKGSATAVNSYTQWSIICNKIPFKAGGKVKELASRSWNDEHGEEAFIPSKTVFEAYDAEFEFAYKGQELATNPFDLGLAMTCISNFKKWLTGNDNLSDYPDGTGAEFKIYSPYGTIGRQGCYLKEISDEEPHLMLKQQSGNVYNETVVTFKATFRVTDPFTDITL